MGQSTDGIIVFGFTLNDDDESSKPGFLGECDDFEEFIAGPWEPNQYVARQALVEACPADVVVHCSGDCRMYILAVRGTKLRAARGYPEKVTLEHMTVSPERIAAFKAWCEEHGIPLEGRTNTISCGPMTSRTAASGLSTD